MPLLIFFCQLFFPVLFPPLEHLTKVVFNIKLEGSSLSLLSYPSALKIYFH